MRRCTGGKINLADCGDGWAGMIMAGGLDYVLSRMKITILVLDTRYSIIGGQIESYSAQ